jgi:predicted Zn-ribbon and HTH transcriptional regulator
MKNKILTPKNAKCDKCGYAWTTVSDMIYITCPCCRKQIKIKGNEHETN